MDFVTDNLVANSTMYTDIFSGATPEDRADFDMLLGRVLNDAERNLQYSTAIYLTGEGNEKVIVVQANGMSAIAVRIPDGLTAADITAFSFGMSGEGLVLGDTVTFRPSFRFSSIAAGVEYFHAMDRGTYYLPQSGALTITHADFTRTGYHYYTVEMSQPELPTDVTLGNYIIMYMGNNGSFRDSTNTSLLLNGFKFWTDEVVTDLTLTGDLTTTTYEVGQTFSSDGLIFTPTYGVEIYGTSTELNHGDLTFDYDFSTVGEKTVTITYREFTFQVTVTVVEPVVE